MFHVTNFRNDFGVEEKNQVLFNKQYVRDSDVFQSVGDVQKRVN